jgi:hypothetical protein
MHDQAAVTVTVRRRTPLIAGLQQLLHLTPLEPRKDVKIYTCSRSWQRVSTAHEAAALMIVDAGTWKLCTLVLLSGRDCLFSHISQIARRGNVSNYPNCIYCFIRCSMLAAALTH